MKLEIHLYIHSGDQDMLAQILEQGERIMTQVADLKDAVSKLATSVTNELAAVATALAGSSSGNDPIVADAIQKINAQAQLLNDSAAALTGIKPPPTGGPVISSLSPTSGAAGTGLTITGTGFGASQGSSTLTFNGTPATPNSWNDTSITVNVPAGATTGPVVVTVNGVASSGNSFGVL